MAESFAQQRHRELLDRANLIPDKLQKAAEMIEMLRVYIHQEESLTGVDGTHFLDPILKRQKEVEERGMACIKLLQNEMSKGGCGQQSLSRQKALTVSVRNIMRNGEISKSQDSASPQMPLVSGARIREQQPLPSHNVVDTDSNVSVALSREEESAHVPVTVAANHDASPWYGSLDRNMVKKKRKSHLDRSRRHTKAVGSMAGLEQTDYLQPDEEYKIGLPHSFSQVTILERRFEAPNENSNISGPKLPPRSTSVRRGDPVSPYRHMSVLDPKVMQYHARWGSDNGDSAHRPLPIPRMYNNETTTARREAQELSKSKESLVAERNGNSRGWLETHLDETIAMNPRFKSEVLPTTKIEGVDQTDSGSMFVRNSASSPASEIGSRGSNSSETRLFINESSKPFVTTDYLKYSLKHRNNQQQSGLTGPTELNPHPHQRSMSEQYDKTTQGNPPPAPNLNQESLRGLFERQGQRSEAAKVGDTNGNSEVPDLPPKGRGGYGRRVPIPPPVSSQDPAYLDEEVAWVMDSPTFV